MSCKQKALGIFASAAFYLLQIGAAMAGKLSLQSCIGSIDTVILEAEFSDCEEHLEQKSTTPRKKAELLLQLGISISVYYGLNELYEKGVEGSSMIRTWKKAIEADKTYADTYLVIARSLNRVGQKEAALSYLHDASRLIPDDVRIAAELADMIASPETVTEVLRLCDNVMQHASLDRSAAHACARSYWRSGLKVEGERAFLRAAFDFDQAKYDRFRVANLEAIGHDYFEHLVREGRNQDARRFFETYRDKNPDLLKTFYAWVAVGELYEKLDEPAQAAKAFEAGARTIEGDIQYKIRLRQVANLAAAGKTSEARLVSEDLLKQATKKQILMLQLQLKNGTQTHLEITGKLNEETRRAFENCLADSGCFSARAGSLL